MRALDDSGRHKSLPLEQVANAEHACPSRANHGDCDCATETTNLLEKRAQTAPRQSSGQSRRFRGLKVWLRGGASRSFLRRGNAPSSVCSPPGTHTAAALGPSCSDRKSEVQTHGVLY